jgi:hypothetical protein
LIFSSKSFKSLTITSNVLNISGMLSSSFILKLVNCPWGSIAWHSSPPVCPHRSPPISSTPHKLYHNP